MFRVSKRRVKEKADVERTVRQLMAATNGDIEVNGARIAASLIRSSRPACSWSWSRWVSRACRSSAHCCDSARRGAERGLLENGAVWSVATESVTENLAESSHGSSGVTPLALFSVVARSRQRFFEH